MRSIVLSGARSCLVALLIFSLLDLPVLNANEKPLGMVVTADRAQLDNAKALSGADVYSGDALATEPGGSLRMKVGASQVYLLASSSATLIPQENKVQAKIERGTVGFSTPAPSQFEIVTPLGVVSGANGQRVFGQVSVVTATSILVTTYEGALLVRTVNGEEKTIDQGQTYEATLLPETAGGGQGPAGAGTGGGGQGPAGAGTGGGGQAPAGGGTGGGGQAPAGGGTGGGGQAPTGVGGPGVNWDHVAQVAVPAVVLGVISYVLWREESESCSTPNCD